jgi:hypothetical protein
MLLFADMFLSTVYKDFDGHDIVLSGVIGL